MPANDDKRQRRPILTSSSRTPRRPFTHVALLVVILVAVGYQTFFPVNVPGSRLPATTAQILDFGGESSVTANLSPWFALENHLDEGAATEPTIESQHRSELAAVNSSGSPSAASTTPDALSSTPVATATVTSSPVPSSPASLSTLPASCDTSQSSLFCVYTVQAGDTLSSIARTFSLNGNDDVPAWEMVMHSNRPEIADDNQTLQIGQRIRVPLRNGIVHTVLSAQSLWDVVDQYGVTIEAITEVADNHVADANTISIGQELFVPSPTRLHSPGVSRAVTPVPQLSAANSASESTRKESSNSGSPSTFEWPNSGPLSSTYSASHPLGIDIDLYATPNAPNRAAASGVVTFAGGNPCCSYGYYVIVDHGNGIETLYAHFSKLSVTVGDRVDQGEVLGLAGNTGYSTGNHLHFEVRKNGTLVNPLEYLP